MRCLCGSVVVLPCVCVLVLVRVSAFAFVYVGMFAFVRSCVCVSGWHDCVCAFWLLYVCVLVR